MNDTIRLVFSVAYVIDRDGIWLGLKKARQTEGRREQLGIGLLNGFGGLMESGESIEATAKRELLAESGFEALEIEKCGIVRVLHDYDRTVIELHFFLVTKHRGSSKESDEMIPKWFRRDKIPYLCMWPNDRYTLPRFLDGQKCVGLFTLDPEGRLAGPPKVRVAAALPETIDWQSF